jgi:hypothetical protein
MSRGAAGSRSTAGTASPAPSGLTVQHLETWSAAAECLSASTLERLCGKDVPNQARRAQLALSHVIVAMCRNEPIGFTAYKPGTAGIRVAHELWVDSNAQCGVAVIADLLLGQLEKEALKSGCSKLFIIVPQATPLRRILQTYGYAITLEGADLLWFEKAFRVDSEAYEE